MAFVLSLMSKQPVSYATASLSTVGVSALADSWRKGNLNRRNSANLGDDEFIVCNRLSASMPH
jgi:hypothetical protein